ncbi:hypothetical protein Esi_0097_0008 [Ectocarpus siliculosus]|uniref:Uncharacterized protein n=1 Tax=Ectocarpus siliculosus TaxID=2880 RepID=D7G999_ECTSI|nr:hypothetical protein Esi_0097_0008 [Ectocarpus siliculosus]|eukprot:CBJ28242.1 hypothetical protein Esi_0097_0008 [Ectocarpus siliculosus]
MSGGVPKRAQWADDTDSDVDEVIAMPIFNNAASSSSWTPCKRGGWRGFRATDPPLPVCVESASWWMSRCWKASVTMSWCAGLGPGTCRFDDHVTGITPGSSRKAVAAVGTKSSGKKGMTSWADSDTESDVDNAGPPPKKLDAFGESESESESESEDESEDDEEEPPANTGVVGSAAVAGEEEPESAAVTGDDATKVLNLSKKERKALKQKELDDLDALLGEFGVDVAPEEPATEANGSAAAAAGGGDAGADVAAAAAAGAVAGEGGEGAGGKKKKKKKKGAAAADKKTGAAGEGEGDGGALAAGDKGRGEEPPVVVIQPITAALKKKGKKKSSAGGGANHGAAALKAAKEAAEKEGKKKKKRDKKNFNQAPPGK